MQFKIYTHLHRVTYADCSNGNHVYYGRYSYFLEEARGEFFRYLGITFNDYHKNVFKNLVKSMSKIEALELKKACSAI
mgnify:CR=1 FL=1